MPTRFPTKSQTKKERDAINLSNERRFPISKRRKNTGGNAHQIYLPAFFKKPRLVSFNCHTIVGKRGQCVPFSARKLSGGKRKELKGFSSFVLLFTLSLSLFLLFIGSICRKKKKGKGGKEESLAAGMLWLRERRRRRRRRSGHRWLMIPSFQE